MKTSLALLVLPLAAASSFPPPGVDGHDYIIVGGGTSGLVVAKRLSEDPSVSVLVIEAGDNVENNVNVTNPLAYGYAFGTSIDYQYQTTNQIYAGGAKQTIRAGKALGGTSTINGMAYTRAEISQIDAWEQIGNEGWNWDNLLPYYLKSEHFQIPSAERARSGFLTYDLDYHGLEGPGKTGWIYGTSNDSIATTLNTTYQSMGVPWNTEVNDGGMVGYTVYPMTVDQELNVREDAARAYYYPFQNQPNLKVLLNTRVSRIAWKPSSNRSEPTADGVEIDDENGIPQMVKAKREVILAAGALASPLLLELSGVGNPAILSQYGIPTVVDLPTVGENLQDQMNNGLAFSANNYSVTGKTTYVAYPSASQIFGKETNKIAAQLSSSLASYAAQVASVNNHITSESDLLKFFKLQYDLIFESQVPLAEVLVFQSNGAWASEYWALLPFSRGNIHISGNTIENANINPNYFMLDWDMQEQIYAARFIRQLFSTEPFSSTVSEETTPGLDTVPLADNYDAWAKWIKDTYRSNFHPVGTAAMMPKEIGGVVDTSLKVYGTANVRVVDASVLPFQVCGHLVSTVYAVAERVSDLIKLDQRRRLVRLG